MGENCQSAGSSALRWGRRRKRRKRTRRRKRRRRRSVKEFLISFRESFSLLAAPYRSAKISTYCRDTPHRLAFPGKLCTFCLLWSSRSSQRQIFWRSFWTYLRYTLLLFLGSCVHFACGVLGHHKDTFSGAAFGHI